MFALLIIAGLLWPVTFPGGQKVTVQLPDYGPEDLVTTDPPRIRFNPQRRFAAVQTSWSAGAKYAGGDVFLVHPSRPTLRLAESQVGRLLWTANGHHLIGAGKTTVRLWNLQGTLRQATPSLPGRWLKTRETIDRQITGVALGKSALGKSALCVRARFVLAEAGAFAPVPGALGGKASPAEAPVTEVLQTVSRYSLPTLRLLARAPVSGTAKALPCS